MTQDDAAKSAPTPGSLCLVSEFKKDDDMNDRETQKQDFEEWAGREGLDLWEHMSTREYVIPKTKTAWAAFRAGDRSARMRLLAKQLDSVENCAPELSRNQNDAMGAWTRVGERLPEYGVQVIAWTGDGGYPVIAYLRRDEHGDFWESFHDSEEIDPACITLWTPMPKQPPFERTARRSPEANTGEWNDDRHE